MVVDELVFSKSGAFALATIHAVPLLIGETKTWVTACLVNQRCNVRLSTAVRVYDRVQYKMTL